MYLVFRFNVVYLVFEENDTDILGVTFIYFYVLLFNGCRLTMTAQLITSELATLIQESKRKNPDLRAARL